jgi:hypothetical protein
MERKTVAFIIGVALATVFATGAITMKYHPQLAANTTPVTIIYSVAVFEPSAAATPSRTNQETLAVRSDGSFARANSGPTSSGELPTARLINLPDRYFVVDPFTLSVASYNKQMRPLVAAPKDCGGQHGDPILGHATQIVHRQDPPAMKITEWLGVDVNCLPLRSEYSIQDADRDVRGIKVAESITLGEPRADWFLVPAGFQERSPSEIQAQHDIKNGDSPRKLNPAIDSVYDKNKAVN